MVPCTSLPSIVPVTSIVTLTKIGMSRPTSLRAARAALMAAFTSDFRDLKPGDRVVHVDHGVGRYTGLGRPRGGSLNRDFMVLEFAGGDRLFVPVDRLDLVQKYTGVGGHRPALDRLGGGKSFDSAGRRRGGCSGCRLRKRSIFRRAV